MLIISLREFFVHKNATRVDYNDAALRLFLYCFLQVSLFVDVHKKKTSYPKEFLGDPALGRDTFG